MNTNKILKQLLLSTILLLFVSYANSQNSIGSIMEDYAEFTRKEISSPFTGSVLVAKNGKVIYADAYGLKNREENIPNEVDTKFPIGSITKQFTAMLVMQMVEEETLKLHDSLSKYLGYLPKAFTEKITIHQLLAHTSGLPHYEGLTEIGINMKTFARTSYAPKELSLLISKMKFKAEPGEIFHYSSFGYMLLGTILEEVSGKTYSELLKDRITKPLGLNSTGFATNEFMKNETAKGYAFRKGRDNNNVKDKFGGKFIEAPHRDQSNTFAGGGMYSTVHDLYIWSEAIRNNKLISPSTSKLMLSPVKNGFAYGWVRNWQDNIESNKLAKLYSHTGSTFGHASAIGLFDDGTTIIFTCNIRNIKAQKIMHQLYLAANNLEDIYRVEGYPDRSSLAVFEKAGGVKALKMYFKNVSELCGYEVKPSSGSLQQIIAMYYENGKNKKGDHLKEDYYDLYDRTEDNINRLAYKILRSDCQKAIEVFKENTVLFPDSPNVWDSLGEGYLACKEYKNAMKSFTMAVNLATKQNDSGLSSFQKNLKKAQSLVQ